MKKRIIPVVAAAILIAAASALIFMLTNSYLIDKEAADNIITIGNIKAEIEEGSFNESSTYPLDAGTVVDKSPSVKNTGVNDEYVFLKVTVPKKEVTFLQEDGVNKGKKDGVKRKAELFKMLTDSDGTAISGTDISFSYHANASDKAGWLLIKRDTSGADSDTFIFGYNKKLKAGSDGSGESTVTLFDKVQLKSFIDEELTGNEAGLTVDVKCAALQADNLEITGLSDSYDGYLTEPQIRDIYSIVYNKQVM